MADELTEKGWETVVRMAEDGVHPGIVSGIQILPFVRTIMDLKARVEGQDRLLMTLMHGWAEVEARLNARVEAQQRTIEELCVAVVRGRDGTRGSIKG